MNKKTHSECMAAIKPVQDALDVLSGKWKLLIITSISVGNHRFREIERSIPSLSSKVLSKELKDLEQHHLVKRTVSVYSSMEIEYTLLPHAKTLRPVIKGLRDWGTLHRREVFGK